MERKVEPPREKELRDLGLLQDISYFPRSRPSPEMQVTESFVLGREERGIPAPPSAASADPGAQGAIAEPVAAINTDRERESWGGRPGMPREGVSGSLRSLSSNSKV